MSAIGEKLNRLQAIQHGSAPSEPGRRVDAAFAGPLATALIAVILIALVFAVVLLPKNWVAAGAISARPPTVAQVAAAAGFAPHVLANGSPMPSYLRPTATKGPMPGTAGIVLAYPGFGVDVYEYRDPNPTAPLGVNPQTQAPAVAQQLSGVATVVWLSPDRSQVLQVGFKTTDDLVINVIAHSGISPDRAQSLVGELVRPPTPN